MKRVLVTGAAKGIGRAVAEQFAGEGAALVVFDVDAAGLEIAAAALRDAGAKVEAVVGSVASAPDCEAAAKRALSAFGGLDVLSHNAGIQRYGTVETTSDELWAEVIGVNLTGAFRISKAVMPMLRESKGSRPYGFGPGLRQPDGGRRLFCGQARTCRACPRHGRRRRPAWGSRQRCRPRIGGYPDAARSGGAGR